MTPTPEPRVQNKAWP